MIDKVFVFVFVNDFNYIRFFINLQRKRLVIIDVFIKKIVAFNFKTNNKINDFVVIVVVVDDRSFFFKLKFSFLTNSKKNC